MNRIVFALALGFLLTAAGAMAAQVTNVGLGYQDGSTVVRIDVQGPIRFTHATEVPKEGRPDRIIVDILSATHELGAREFLDLPSCVVTGIRSSQYSVSPEKIVRVVLDISRSPIYRVESDDRSITIYIDDKSATSFPAWSSSGVAAGTLSNAVAPSPSAPAASEAAAESDNQTTTVAQKNEQIEQDRQVSLANNVSSEPVQPESQTVAEPVPEPVSVPVRKPAPSVKDLMAAFGKPTWASKQAATEASLPESEPKSAAPVTPDEPVVAQTEMTPVEVQPALQAPAVTEPTTTDLTVQPASNLWTPEAFALQAADQFKPEGAATPAVMPVVEAVTPDTQARVSESLAVKQVEPVAESASAPAVVAETSPAAIEKPSVQESDSAKPIPADFLPALPEGSGDQMATDDSTMSKSSTARFRRSSATSIKTKGTMVAEFPQRLVIKYESDIYRDPFATLLDDERTYNSPVEQRIPNVEGLKLVGVLESVDAANRALFEDKDGYSYILKSGDKVRSGYVLRVEADCVYFQVFEYGWSRTVALTME
jgi:hypothetical protein